MKYQYQHFNLYYNTLEELDNKLNELGEEGWNLEILGKQWRNAVFGKRKNPINKKIKENISLFDF